MTEEKNGSDTQIPSLRRHWLKGGSEGGEHVRTSATARGGGKGGKRKRRRSQFFFFFFPRGGCRPYGGGMGYTHPWPPAQQRRNFSPFGSGGRENHLYATLLEGRAENGRKGVSSVPGSLWDGASLSRTLIHVRQSYPPSDKSTTGH